MPYINVKVAKKLNDEKREELHLEIAQNITILPGKVMSGTTIVVEDDCFMVRDGKPMDGIFIEVRLYKPSPDDAKKNFADNLFSIMENVLDIPPANTQINYMELPTWGVDGKLLI